MERGVPTLDVPHTVCEKGKTLTPEQTQLLKLVGTKMVTFKVGLRARWDASTGEVEQIQGEEIAPDEAGGEDGEDEEMSE